MHKLITRSMLLIKSSQSVNIPIVLCISSPPLKGLQFEMNLHVCMLSCLGLNWSSCLGRSKELYDAELGWGISSQEVYLWRLWLVFSRLGGNGTAMSHNILPWFPWKHTFPCSPRLVQWNHESKCIGSAFKWFILGIL